MCRKKVNNIKTTKLLKEKLLNSIQRKSLFLKKKFNTTICNIYDYVLDSRKLIILFALIISIFFGIFKVLFVNGFNVDSYQMFALSVEKLILTGEQDYLFQNYYVRNRMVYPFFIAILHIIIPIDISLIACFVNLVFSLISLAMIRKIMYEVDFDTKSIDITTLFIILSYNYLNYFFEVISDFTAFAFFLLSLYHLIKFKKSRNILNLLFSFVFFIYSIFARESYIIFVIFYLFIIPNKKISLSLFSILFISFFILPFVFAEKVLLIAETFSLKTVIYFIKYKSLEGFKIEQSKWSSSVFLSDYFKGLFKVGIIASLFFLFIITLLTFKKIKNLKKTKYRYIFISWFITYSIIYSIAVPTENAAPSGLRYWLPVCWIPLTYLSRFIINLDFHKFFKLSLIGFLSLSYITWSIGELYVNRNGFSGTGPYFRQNVYYNDMSDIKSIDSYNQNLITVSVINKTYFNTTLLNRGPDYDSSKRFETTIVFATWLNATSHITIFLRLKSSNASTTTWGIILHEVSPTYSPGIKKVGYSIKNLVTYSEFHEYTLDIDISFLVRGISLLVQGYNGAQILWDCLYIEVK